MKAQSRGKDPRKLMLEWKQQAKEPTRARPKERVEEQIEETEDIEVGEGGEGEEVDIDDVGREEIGLTDKEKADRQAKQEERDYQRNKDYFERLSKTAQDLPKEKVALQQMQGALDSDDFDSWQNVFAEMIGVETLKTASAQVLNSASKQFLLASLSGITGRPNQFLEQSITKALISPLYKKEANQLILEGLQGLSDLKAREIDIAEALEEKYILRGKEPPRNFQKLVRQRLKKDAQAFEKKYEARVRQLLSSKDDQVEVISPDGKKGSIPKSELEDALQQDYKRA